MFSAPNVLAFAPTLSVLWLVARCISSIRMRQAGGGSVEADRGVHAIGPLPSFRCSEDPCLNAFMLVSSLCTTGAGMAGTGGNRWV